MDNTHGWLVIRMLSKISCAQILSANFLYTYLEGTRVYYAILLP